MINFFKKLFGSAVKVPAEAPYKVEAPVPVAKVAPFPAPKKVAKKPAVKKATTTKPRKPRAPKA